MIASHLELEAAFGPFYGFNINFDSSERLAIGYIDKALLKREADLFERKWFDYRVMHPTTATYLLAQAYNDAYRFFMRQAVDVGREHMNGFKGRDFIQTREYASFWRLRQMIDDHGIRYDFFLLTAMTWYFRRNFRQPPRPQHIYSNSELLVDVTSAWVVELRNKLQFTKLPAYRTENFAGATHQSAYERFLLEQIGERRNPAFGLYSAIYRERTLRFEAALTKFGQPVMTEVLEIAGA
jgi:hypothetical protein